MSRTKKLLVGGSIAGLMLSLALPVTNNSGTSGSAVVHAGAGPKFNKPWHYKNSSSGSKSVKSYPMPKDLDSADVPAGGSTGSVEETSNETMMQLESIYRNQSATAPEMTSAPSDLSVQQATARKQRREEAEPVPDKTGNMFTRFFDRLTGRDDVIARRQNLATKANKPTPPAPVTNTPGNFFEPVDADAPQSYVAVPAPSEMEVVKTPTADVIIPPQPVPNYLPNLDFADINGDVPNVSGSNDAGASSFDPFPLPPLPDGFDRSGTKTAQTNVSSPDKASEMLIPPLPGMETVPATAAATPMKSVDASLALEVPEMPADFANNSAAVKSAHPLADSETVQESPVAETSSLPVSTDVSTDFAGVDREVLRENAAALADQAVDEGPVKRGEKDTNLPLAPSANLAERWRDRRADVAESQKADASPLPSGNSGWRNRAEHLGQQEPNQLNVPAEARPAELPPQATAESDPAQKYQRIAERGERTGFKGFCPVALRDHLELVDATPEFRAEFEGQIFYFSSVECRRLFEADPIRYVPAHGGMDLVTYLQEGQETPGRLDYAVWYQDRLFLFANQTTLETFRAEPARYVGE